MKINILGVVKGVAELAVSAGVGVVVGNLVRATTPEDLSRVQKIMVGVGGYAIGGVLGDLSAKHVSGQIDEYATRVREIINPPVDEEAVEVLQETLDEVTEQKEKSSKSEKPSDDE